MSNPRTVDVKCAFCAHDTQIMEPADPDIAIGWQCPECGAPNHIDGHAGPPGEGAFGTAATLLDDDALVDAAVRRGLVKAEDVEAARAAKAAVDAAGAAAPAGTVDTQTITGGDVGDATTIIGGAQ